MSIPQPSTQLEGHCAAIDNDTLYFLSPDGFQSLRLQENATWSDEKSGVPVTGPACVTAVPDGDEAQAALYVVGGVADDASFGGLQRYFFGNKTWESLSPPADVMQGRTNHSAVFLQDSQSILVYAGSQPSAPSLLSSQTFLISLQPPFNIQSFTSEAPTTNLPILQPWNSSHAVMVGGSPWNLEPFTFGPSDGWQSLGTNLTEPPNPATRGTIVDGDDGSKVLELYDFSASPNNVSQIVLLGAHGRAARNGQTVGGSQRPRKRKRDLTLKQWPKYNSTNAPAATRADCTVVQGSNGVAVVAGGSSDVPVALFNQDDNSWVDAGKFFNAKDIQKPLKPTQTSSMSASTPSSTASASPSTTAASSGGSSHNRTLKTLGIILGVLCGIAVLFVLTLLFLRWRKRKKRQRDGYLDEKTGARMSFADRGASFMKEAEGSVQNLNIPKNGRNLSQLGGGGSHSSLAIIAGKFGARRNTTSHITKSSFDSTTNLVNDRNGVTLVGEPVELVDIRDKRQPVQRKPISQTYLVPPETAQYGSTLTEQDARGRKNRSSGWSKYFATSGPTGPNGLSHLPEAYAKELSAEDPEESNADRKSSQPARIPSSILMAPLDIDFSKTVDGQRLSHVTSGSPSLSDSRDDLATRGSAATGSHGQKGLIVNPDGRPRSQSESVSSFNNRSTLSSTIASEFLNESINGPWTPVSTSFKDHLTSRRTSSIYTDSTYDARDRVPSRGKSAGFFPGAGTSYRPPPKARLSPSTTPSANKAPTISKPPPPPPPPPPAAPTAPTSIALDPNHLVTTTTTTTAAAPAITTDATDNKLSRASAITVASEVRGSGLTVFPRGVPSAYYAGREREPDQPAAATLTPAAAAAAATAAKKPMNSDLGWLNLGLNGGRS